MDGSAATHKQNPHNSSVPTMIAGDDRQYHMDT
jgi:hypothetical protein